MDILKITLNEEGRVIHYAPDFKVMRGSYGNILINIEVPHNLLIDAVTDDTGNNITGNTVKIGAVIRTITGANLQTKNYKLSRIKDFERNGIQYRLYQRRCPKVFTMWETVSMLENATSGMLEMIVNVVNWHLNELGSKVEEIATTQIVQQEVYQSDYLDNDEEIDNPTDFDILQGQVQEIAAEIAEVQTDLYGAEENSLGNYLKDRLKAGNKIILTEDNENALNNRIEISVDVIKAKEVPIDKIDDLEANDVQTALVELCRRNDSKSVDSVKGENEGLVDNTDPNNPIIKHDDTKPTLPMNDVEYDRGLVVKVDGTVDWARVDNAPYENTLVRRDTNGNVKTNVPLEGVDAANKEYVDVLVDNQAKTNINNNFSASQTIDGDLILNGNIYQQGEAYITEAEHLQVEDALIYTRANAEFGMGANEYTGLIAKKYDGVFDGALIYDNQGVARIGDVTITDGVIDASQTQPLATRSESADLVDGHTAQWDATNQKLIDSGSSMGDKLDKVTTEGSNRLYRVDYLGINSTINYTPSSTGGTIMSRDIDGKSKIATATEEDDVKTIVNKEYVDPRLELKVDLPTDTTAYDRGFVYKADGTKLWQRVENEAYPNTLARRNSGGQLKVNTPVYRGDAVNLGYLQDNYTKEYSMTVSEFEALTSYEKGRYFVRED